MRDLGAQRTGLWTGDECEGKWRGTYTVFLRDPTLAADALSAGPRHLYVLREALDGVELAPFLNRGFIVTLEVPVERVAEISKRHPIHHPFVRTQVCLDASWAALLGANAEIRLELAPFRTISFAVGDGLQSVPADYEKDREVRAHRE